MSRFVLVRRNRPVVVRLEGWTLPVAPRRGRSVRAASYRPECPCGWAGETVTSDTAARSEAIRHTCEAN